MEQNCKTNSFEKKKPPNKNILFITFGYVYTMLQYSKYTLFNLMPDLDLI